MDTNSERSEIAFFDVETTVPSKTGQGFALLEFGAILVCPKKLVELDHYSTLIRPSDLSLISATSVRCNGITRAAVSSAPSFLDIADKVFDILNGRIWAGHNIIRFDCVRIREAFAEIGRVAPEPKGIIDSLALLTQKFGRRAGDMKMATLATYFGLGQQTHRSLDDVRMNLEVVKYCATVLFLESSLPDIFMKNSCVSPNASTRSHRKGKVFQESTKPKMDVTSSSIKFESYQVLTLESRGSAENCSTSSPMVFRNMEVPNLVGSHSTQADPFNMGHLSNEIGSASLRPDADMEENQASSSTVVVQEGCSTDAGFLEPDEVSVSLIRASLVPSYHGSQRIDILHDNSKLQLHCTNLRVRFGVNTKFVDHAGRPRLNLLVDTSPSLCQVLDACDMHAQKLSVDSGSSSEWRPVVIRKNGFFNSSTARLHIPLVTNGDICTYATEMYQKNSSNVTQKLVFTRFDASEIERLFTPGMVIDAYFTLEQYDYQQNAGIRLVAKKLIIQSN
ncbi:Exonuclease, RNase T/DNA polymerase III [Dillenia turbinata]|uniref:Exonuclease, RNase T/DNA polymerase III n=1 Tax=Dillenia turbinata TaxID=194707 RepID=A0AAN8YZI3_9MAGN